MLNGKIVIPAGSPAQGEITSVRNKGMWGKSGHITARVLYATVGGRQIRLSGLLTTRASLARLVWSVLSPWFRWLDFL
jgi:hypothetical protein